MAGHLLIRCANFRFLVLSENVHSINLWTAPIHALAPRVSMSRQPDLALVLDARVLLGAGTPDRNPPRVALDWRSSDGQRGATLIVDAVDRLVNCDAHALLSLPRVPKQVHALFDRVMFDQKIFLLRLKPDAELDLSCFAGLRRLRSAAIAVDRQNSLPITPLPQVIS